MSDIIPIEVTEASVLAKCDYFADVQIWPLRRKLNPKRWLENFERTEMEHALYLLNSFIYVSSDLSNQMFRAAFLNICNDLHAEETGTDLSIVWKKFLSSVLVTNVTGEIPSITDSGMGYARKAKQLLSIPESQILENEEVLEIVCNNEKPIVFVDDFVGSGNQFKRTWNRKYTIGGSKISFKDLAMNGYSSRIYYIPLVSTQDGFGKILKACPQVNLLPVHLVDNRYSVFNLMSKAVWPDHLRSTALAFIQKASKRAGMDMYDPECWMGFERLGLAIVFEDSIPDATLPLFTWDKHGWQPLVKII